MVMGPTHAMSSAALTLGAITAFNITVAPISPTIAVIGTIMASGAALAPDIDSRQATVVRAFGVFGLAAHYLVNGLSVAVHTATRTRYDSVITNGHRTFFHTTFMAVLMGGLIALAVAPTNKVTIFGEELPLGHVIAIILMSIFLNLALSGLLEKQIKKFRKASGPYLLMLVSLGISAGIAFTLPDPDGTYAYLGIAVAFGWFAHILGDAITKMGVPMAWPLKISGKRWYDVALPSFLRISAGGKFEYVILLPLCTLATVILIAYNFLYYLGAL